jgi:hypothetical protein
MTISGRTVLPRYVSLGLLALLTSTLCTVAQPIRLHPQNPHYFVFRGRPTVLITSGEHYGMVLNSALHYTNYLDTLATNGLNYTRIFSGTYVEKAGAFGIERNNLAPGPGAFLAPWARSATPGYAGGGAKFDLTRLEPRYFERLQSFLKAANERNIVVELTLFSSLYNEEQWSVNAFHPVNNVNGIGIKDWKKLHTLTNGPILAFQERLVRELVRRLNTNENLIWEIQNEPWSDNHSMGEIINPYLTNSAFPNAVEITTQESIRWQARVGAWIAEEESRLPYRHLIAQNIANFRWAVRASDLAPAASILHFHYAYPEAALWNLNLGKAIGYDETGFAGSSDATYRREAWNFMLSGGGLFNNLDYSFTLGQENGTDLQANGPGGGSPLLREHLGILRRFLESFNLALLRPDPLVVRHCGGAVARAMSVPGKEYAIYMQGTMPCELRLALPAGRYQLEWISTLTGAPIQVLPLVCRTPETQLQSPKTEGEVVLRLRAM